MCQKRAIQSAYVFVKRIKKNKIKKSLCKLAEAAKSVYTACKQETAALKESES